MTTGVNPANAAHNAQKVEDTVHDTHQRSFFQKIGNIVKKALQAVAIFFKTLWSGISSFFTAYPKASMASGSPSGTSPIAVDSKIPETDEKE